MLIVQWRCGYYFGEPKWHGLDFFEPDECGQEFETEVEEEDWESEISTAQCPKCGASLTQKDDLPGLK